MIVCIAEKPSVARDIADVLGAKGHLLCGFHLVKVTVDKGVALMQVTLVDMYMYFTRKEKSAKYRKSSSLLWDRILPLSKWTERLMIARHW